MASLDDLLLTLPPLSPNHLAHDQTPVLNHSLSYSPSSQLVFPPNSDFDDLSRLLIPQISDYVGSVPQQQLGLTPQLHRPTDHQQIRETGGLHADVIPSRFHEEEGKVLFSGRDPSYYRERVVKESLRRKTMTKWFSRLELLLPPQELGKFDRCSLLDSTISYIRSLQKSASELSETIKAMKANSRERQVDLVNTSDPGSSPISNPPTKVSQQQEIMPVVVVNSDSTEVFVNAVSKDRDPLLFSRLLSAVQTQQLQILSATRSQNKETVIYTIHAKIPEHTVHLHEQLLKDQLYDLIADRCPRDHFGAGLGKKRCTASCTTPCPKLSRMSRVSPSTRCCEDFNRQQQQSCAPATRGFLA